MTIKEITALRKAGRLQEALQAAETEFASSQNKYTASALFWCLNDLYKQQEQEEALSTLERMEALYEDYCSGDKMMLMSLTYARRIAKPFSQEIKDALAQAKNGADITGTYSKILEAYNSQSLDKSLYSDFGWMVYYVLKRTPLNNAYARKTLLNQYLMLELPKPSLLHSLILGEAIKIEKNTPLQFRIRDFIRLWGLENLMEDDWKQFKTDQGHFLPSTVEKLIGAYAKEIKTDRVVAPPEFNDLVDKALTIYPNNQNIPQDKAVVLMSQGEKGKALECYKDLILKYPSKFYLWSQVAELTDDIDIKLGLLCKAITLGVEDTFLGGIRLKIASILLAKGLYANARYELDQYKETYTSQGWNLKAEYWHLLNQVSTVQATDSNSSLYAQFCPEADKFIYSALPSIFAIKVSDKLLEDRNHPGRKFVLWTLRTKNDILRVKKPSKFGLERSKNGSVFEVKVLDDKVVWIKPSQVSLLEQDWIKEAEGAVTLRTDRNGKTYAILNGVYIGEKFLRDIKSGQNVKIIALSQQDSRWSAISLAKK